MTQVGARAKDGEFATAVLTDAVLTDGGMLDTMPDTQLIITSYLRFLEERVSLI